MILHGIPLLAKALASFITYMINLPNERSKLRAELDQLETKDGLTLSMVEKLEYMRLAICESMRLSSPMPITTSESTVTEACPIAGVTIHPGDIIHIAIQ